MNFCLTSERNGLEDDLGVLDQSEKTGGIYELTPSLSLAKIMEEVMFEDAIILYDPKQLHSPEIMAVVRRAGKNINISKQPFIWRPCGFMGRIGQPYQWDFNRFLRCVK